MSSDVLKNLKDLLLKPEQDELQRLNVEVSQLQQRLGNREILLETLKPVLTPLLREKILEQPQEIAAVLAPVIAESLKKQIEISRETIVAALSPIMGRAIKKQVNDAREEIVDALYPVIGQTIRKSVSEAMKKLAQTVNEKIDRALSLNLLLKKIRSRISGVPLDEYLLKDFLPFQIREIFYIHRTSGILLAHVSDKAKTSSTDEELISGMFTAIKDFARTAFSGEIERDLNSIAYDDLQIYMEAGRYAYLALVTSGVPPSDFSTRMQDLEQHLHREYHQQLHDFSGDLAPLQNVHHPLQNFLTSYQDGKHPVSRPRGSRGLYYLLAILMIMIILVVMIFYLPEKIKQNRISTQIKSQLKNPPLSTVKGLNWEYHHDLLTLNGAVDNSEAKQTVQDYFSGQLGFKEIQNNLVVKPSAEDLAGFQQQLISSLQHKVMTDLSSLQLIMEHGILCIRGKTANSQDKLLIMNAVAEISHLRLIMAELTTPQESWQQQEILKKEIEQYSVHFAENHSEISNSNFPMLDELAEQLKAVSFENLIITGYCDSLGKEEENLELSRTRAASVRDYLVLKGIAPEKLTVRAGGETFSIADNLSREGRSRNRRVNFQFTNNK